MIIRHSKNFRKQFRKLPKHALNKFEERLLLLLQNPNNPTLNNHKLSGKHKKHRSINITGDYRLVFSQQDNFLDLEVIGTHSELYE